MENYMVIHYSCNFIHDPKMNYFSDVTSAKDYIRSLRESGKVNSMDRYHIAKVLECGEAIQIERGMIGISTRNLVSKKELRPVGDITLDMEPLLCELALEHELQMGEILGLVKSYLEIHVPDCKEEYTDGTNPVYFYGHKKGLRK